MTREEAKEILTHNWTRVDNPNYSESELDEAFFMAIEALSAEALFKQDIDFHKEVSRIEAEKVVDLEHKLADAVHIHNDGTLEVKVPNAQKVGRVLVMDTDSHIGGGLFYQDDAVSGYSEWLEKIIVDNEGANEWLCEDTPDMEWCEKNCHYSSIQAECLRHLYAISKGGAE